MHDINEEIIKKLISNKHPCSWMEIITTEDFIGCSSSFALERRPAIESPPPRTQLPNLTRKYRGEMKRTLLHLMEQ
eukprot:6487055-Amphidinium_carterae.1